MFRLLVIFAAFAFAMPCVAVNAQKRGGFWNRGALRGGAPSSHSHHNRYRGASGYRTYSQPTLFGFSFGTQPYGYDYAGYPDPYFTYPYSLDPWSRGSFRAPDLLDDPYFYDRVPPAHRYPAARHSHSHDVRPLVPTTTHRGNSHFETYVDRDPTLTASPAIEAPSETLSSASERLLRNLASYGGGDAWIEYLAPDRIQTLADQDNMMELRELMARFDGVSQNRELRAVAQIDGFAATQFFLRQYLNQTAQAQAEKEALSPAASPLIDEPKFETLPSPQPEPVLESPANDSSEI